MVMTDRPRLWNLITALVVACAPATMPAAAVPNTFVADRSWPADQTTMALEIPTGPSRSVVTSPQTISGHFIAEVSLDVEAGGGLVLMHDLDGRPDPQNLIAIEVSRDDKDQTVVRAIDVRAGKPDVLDPTQQIDRARYRHVLDGQYSLPFKRTDLRLRIARDGATGFFRLSYAVSKTLRGDQANGWISLAPVPGWAESGQAFHIGVLSPVKSPTKFSDLKAYSLPTADRDDRKRGFALERRPFHWSGFAGDAVVITFQDTIPQHPSADENVSDTKFVFWEGANYMPAWHFSNQLLFTQQSLETWGGGSPGCYEPMSDRLLRWSRVDVVHDSAVRKVVRWRYVLCDPDYRVPNNEDGTQLPEAEELWTFYPDGTAIRLMTYFPKLDTDFRNWHEVMELIAIAGTSTNPSDHLASPALTLADLGQNVQRFYPDKSFDKEAVNRWGEFISVAHFKQAPDVFSAFVNLGPLPETLRPYPVRFTLDWHNTDYRFAHWPAETEPFQESHKTHGTFTEQASHTSLIGAGIWEGTDWTDRYQTDDRGRKFRQWVSLVGLHQPADLEGIRARVRAWRDAPSLHAISGADHEIRFNHASGDYAVRPSGNQLRFKLAGPNIGMAPAPLRLIGWAGRTPRLEVAGTLMDASRFRFADEQDALLLQILEPIPPDTEVSIDAAPVTPGR
jgi:hypothetical protein